MSRTKIILKCRAWGLQQMQAEPLVQLHRQIKDMHLTRKTHVNAKRISKYKYPRSWEHKPSKSEYHKQYSNTTSYDQTRLWRLKSSTPRQTGILEDMSGLVFGSTQPKETSTASINSHSQVHILTIISSPWSTHIENTAKKFRSYLCTPYCNSLQSH